MNLRKLKKKKFKICFDWLQEYFAEHYSVIISWDGKQLAGTAESEYDNGLYIETHRYDFEPTWKDLKYNLTHYTKRDQAKHRMPYHVYLYNGKCKYCNKSCTFEEFEQWNGFIHEDCSLTAFEKFCLEEDARYEAI